MAAYPYTSHDSIREGHELLQPLFLGILGRPRPGAGACQLPEPHA